MINLTKKIRDSKGMFIKGARFKYENVSKIKKESSLKNLKNWIGRKPPMLGKHFSIKSREKMSISAIGKHTKEKNGQYISDRTKLAKKQIRNDYSYIDFRKKCCDRDNWKCKINNQECYGRLEIHHILSWKEFPELRYDINNGIALCHAHHPRTRAKEKRLIPYFMKLVSVSK